MTKIEALFKFCLNFLTHIVTYWLERTALMLWTSRASLLDLSITEAIISKPPLLLQECEAHELHNMNKWSQVFPALRHRRNSSKFLKSPPVWSTITFLRITFPLTLKCCLQTCVTLHGDYKKLSNFINFTFFMWERKVMGIPL